MRARQRRNRIRWIATGTVLAIVLAIVALLIGPGGSPKTAATTTSVAAKGKPCVAVADPLPKGAPAVPVEIGPPPTKLVTKDLEVGTGAVVKAHAQLSVDYIGVACSTGKIFDSSYSRGKPASFGLDGVIPGWQQGIPGMKVGGTRLLGIPPEDAYKSQGSPPLIGPDETLWFVVHVISAK
jgi:peptidylprolyl isomerase